MNYLQPGQTAVRNFTGARVRIVEVRPIGEHVIYVTEDCRDGHTCIVSHDELRPDTTGGTK